MARCTNFKNIREYGWFDKCKKLCKILIAILSIFNILGCVMIKFINGDSLLILAFLLGIVWLLMLVVFFKLNDYCYEIYKSN